MNKLSEIDYRAILQESYCQDFRTAIHNFVDNEERMYRLFNNVKAKELPTNIRMHKKLTDKFDTDVLYSKDNAIPMLLHVLSYNEPMKLTQKGKCPNCRGRFPKNIIMGRTMFCPFCGQMLEMETEE